MKQKPGNNIILLLTGTINTYEKEFTALKDSGQRKAQYISTIEYYLKSYDYPVVFTENSGENLSTYFTDAIEKKRLEILCFDGNNYSGEIGKGLGEMKCIEYAIQHSVLINDDSFVFKITGRYIILNLAQFINFYIAHLSAELIADLTNNFKASIASIFGFKPFFAKEFLFNKAPLINDSKGFFFEHALAKAVLEATASGINFHIFKYYPRIKAVSGTTGKAYKKSFLYLLPRKLKYLIRYYIVVR